ncbi:DUF433 domain-containing protein [Tautonia plasticadhaerens]|uniref:DUF433 domain-containing protein n=1 Tax=Tautonia plasticadhaerens TaxID=2527974 RepID=A0A518H563_9BACT|nr:DUF433 domain-containing protein [Tautonia plasticadhaerens]QDV35990.1 hypothetical protein ElP_39000 [Tautonia plasticadhaerens]
MSAVETYVRNDEHGVMRVGSTRVMLDSVVAAFQRGDSPESILQQYPSLSLEAVYGAITYYLAHRDEVDDYLRRQEQVWDEERARNADKPDPVTERLRLLKQARDRAG